MKEKLKLIPRPLKKQILIRFLISTASLIIAILMLAIARDMILSLPCLVFFGYMAFDGGRMLYHSVTDKYTTVNGECVGVEKTPVRKRVKTIYIQTEKGKIKMPIRKRVRNLTVGDQITVYMPNKTRIYEHENNLVIFGYYALDIIRQSKRNTIN